MELKIIPIKDLKFAEYNPRTINKENFDRLCRSIKEFGFTVPNTVNSHAGRENVLIGGHMRTRAAEAEGLTEVPCWVVDIDETRERMLNIALNNPDLAGEWDEQMLAEILVKLNEEDANIKLTGFDETQVSSILDDYMDTGEEDTPPGVSKGDPQSKFGEIYELGPHRVMCGDSTNPEDVKKLRGDKTIAMVFTDPPYGLGGYAGRSGKFDSVKGDDEEVKKFYDCIPTDISERYIWGGYPNLLHLASMPRDVIVWNKKRIGMGKGYRKGYRGQYELCFYYGTFKGYDSDIWEVSRDGKYEHPTQKPTSLAYKAIKNSSIRSDIVLDLFGGSGSTLIAAEKAGRVAYLMEIDPHYCDVIRNRYKAYVEKQGQK